MAKLLDQTLQRCQGLNARLPPDDLAVFEQNHGRDAPNLVLLRSRLGFVDINFNYAHLLAGAFGKLLQNRRLLLAGPAPVGIKVNQDRFIAVDKVFKRLLVHDCKGYSVTVPRLRVHS